MKTETPGLESQSKKKIFIVDDHPLLRSGLVRTINLEKDLTVCGEAADAAEAIKQIESASPDLAIIDISLEGMNGIDLIRSLRSKNLKMRILVLSAHRESLYAERALRAGANGYIMKRESGAELLSAIRRVLQGKAYISQEFNEMLLQRLGSATFSSDKPSIEFLSDRELEVFQLVGKGYGTRQIANELHISVKTVESHREHIRAKLNLNNTFELVQRAIDWIHSDRQP